MAKTKTQSDKKLRKKWRKEYGDLLDLFPDYPIVEDHNGTVRWKENPLMSWMYDQVPGHMNAIRAAAIDHDFPIETLYEYYQEIGYSLSGFIEVFGEKLGLYE